MGKLKRALVEAWLQTSKVLYKTEPLTTIYTLFCYSYMFLVAIEHTQSQKEHANTTKQSPGIVHARTHLLMWSHDKKYLTGGLTYCAYFGLMEESGAPRGNQSRSRNWSGKLKWLCHIWVVFAVCPVHMSYIHTPPASTLPQLESDMFLHCLLLACIWRLSIHFPPHVKSQLWLFDHHCSIVDIKLFKFRVRMNLSSVI